MIGNWTRIFLLLPVLYGFTVIPPDIARAADCRTAIDFYNQAVGVEDLGEKEMLYRRALEFECKDKEVAAKIHNNLADTYERQGRLETAIVHYKKAIDIDSFMPTPYLSLGEVYTKLNKPREAQHYYEEGFLLENYLDSDRIVASLSPTRAVSLVPRLSLYFGFNEIRLTEAAIRQLKALDRALKDRELLLYRFQIEGHADSIGSRDFNQDLSEKRAKRVKDWLTAHGILEDRLVTVGFGEDRPAADNSNEEGRRRNRRVEIRTIGVAMLSAALDARSPDQKEALRILRAGEHLLMQERYDDAVENFIRAKSAFEKERFSPGIRAALKDLILAYRFLEEWDRAEQYRRQLEAKDY
jgi:outer membrane protein OmpA-like peptidoglycan-associated protein